MKNSKKKIAVFFTRSQWFALTRIPKNDDLYEENLKRAKAFAIQVKPTVNPANYIQWKFREDVVTGKVYVLDTLKLECAVLDNRDWD